MAQSGLHGLIGLALTQMGGQEAEGFETRTGSMKWGFVVGSMLPDLDVVLIPLLFKYFTQDQLHRTWSHSLVTQGVLCLLAYFLWARKNPQRQGLVSGLWLGMLVHSAADLFMWFAHVDLLWPLGMFGLATDFNAWAGITVPSLVGKLMGAGEFLFLGLFFDYLARLAGPAGVDPKQIATLRKAEWAMYLLTLAAVGLAFFLGATTYTFVIYPVLIVVGLPLAGWAVWRMREAIARTPALPKRKAA